MWGRGGDNITLATTFGRDYCSGTCSNRPHLLRIRTGWGIQDLFSRGPWIFLAYIWGHSCWFLRCLKDLAINCLGAYRWLVTPNWHGTYNLWLFGKRHLQEMLDGARILLQYNKNNGYSRRYQGGPGSSITNRVLAGHEQDGALNWPSDSLRISEFFRYWWQDWSIIFSTLPIQTLRTPVIQLGEKGCSVFSLNSTFPRTR
jgi:hypothetical protein